MDVFPIFKFVLPFWKIPQFLLLKSLRSLLNTDFSWIFLASDSYFAWTLGWLRYLESKSLLFSISLCIILPILLENSENISCKPLVFRSNLHHLYLFSWKTSDKFYTGIVIEIILIVRNEKGMGFGVGTYWEFLI